jgi:hypothetical protein
MPLVYWLIPNAQTPAEKHFPVAVLEITLSFPTKPVTFYFALMGRAVVSLF